MKIRLLNDGGYRDEMRGVEFPVEVDGEDDTLFRMFFVDNSEIKRIGGTGTDRFDGFAFDYTEAEASE